MGLTNAGAAFIANAICNNSSPTFFTSTNAHIGVGASSTAFDKAQTDLITTPTRKKVSGAPTVTGAAMEFSASFGTSDANIAWNEWGVFNAASSGTMLNRKVESLGTKVEGSTWVLTVTLTVVN